MWKNVTTPEKSKVAETLDEFRGNYVYNLLDDNVRRFNAEIPQFVLWDDHEVKNNWFPGMSLEADERYKEKNARVLAAHARRAFLEYSPDSAHARAAGRRSIAPVRYGPLARRVRARSAHLSRAELAEPAARARRGDGSCGRAADRVAEARAAVLHSDLESHCERPADRSRRSRRRDRVRSDRQRRCGLAARARARDCRSASIHPTSSASAMSCGSPATCITPRRITTIPERARFKDFDPFWEFVAGPMNAGTFGPGPLDDTFGPELRFSSVPAGMPPNRPPSDGLQFFGLVRISGEDEGDDGGAEKPGGRGDLHGRAGAGNA